MSPKYNLFVFPAPLRIALRPISQTVRPGDFARINCTAVSGDEPVSITWVRDYNKPLHPAVVVGNDLLVRTNDLVINCSW